MKYSCLNAYIYIYKGLKQLNGTENRMLNFAFNIMPSAIAKCQFREIAIRAYVN